MISQREAMENQLADMSDVPFTYDDWSTRTRLITDVKAMLINEDKLFLVSFEQVEPDWDSVEYGYFVEYPSVKYGNCSILLNYKGKSRQVVKRSNETKYGILNKDIKFLYMSRIGSMKF